MLRNKRLKINKLQWLLWLQKTQPLVGLGPAKKELSNPRYTANRKLSAEQSDPAQQANKLLSLAWGCQELQFGPGDPASDLGPQPGEVTATAGGPVPLQTPLLQHREELPAMQHKVLLLFPPSSPLASLSMAKTFVPIPQSCLQLILEKKKKKKKAMHTNLHFIKIAEIKGHLMKCRTQHCPGTQ